MPSIIINNKNESINVKNYRTLTELLPVIKESYIHDGESLTSIAVNGINVIKNNEMKSQILLLMRLTLLKSVLLVKIASY